MPYLCVYLQINLDELVRCTAVLMDIIVNLIIEKQKKIDESKLIRPPQIFV
jgi:hypothetical protein